MSPLSAGEARARVEQASMVGARQALTGQTLAPRLPATAAALAAGEIGLGQLRVITETIGALPASVPQPARDRADAALAGYARDFDPRRLRIIAQRLLSCLDPDGPPPDDDTTASPPPRGELVAAPAPRWATRGWGLAGPRTRQPGPRLDRATRHPPARPRRRARHTHRASAPRRCAHRAVPAGPRRRRVPHHRRRTASRHRDH